MLHERGQVDRRKDGDDHHSASLWPLWTYGPGGIVSVRNRPVPGRPQVTRRWPCGPTVYHAPRWPIRGPGACAILAGISGDWPYLLGYETRAKPDAEVLLRTGVAPASHPEPGDLRLQSVGPARGYCFNRAILSSFSWLRPRRLVWRHRRRRAILPARSRLHGLVRDVDTTQLLDARGNRADLHLVLHQPVQDRSVPAARLQSFVVVAWGRGATKPYFVDDIRWYGLGFPVGSVRVPSHDGFE